MIHVCGKERSMGCLLWELKLQDVLWNVGGGKSLVLLRNLTAARSGKGMEETSFFLLIPTGGVFPR